LCGHLYVFTNRQHNRIKLLYADGTRIWVCAKRLCGRGTFAWPKTTEPGALQIFAAELTLLLANEQTKRRSRNGLPLTLARPK